MSKTLIVAEKPDQAKSFYVPMIERITGEKFVMKQGYMESPGYYVTWMFGHLLGIMEPEEYDEKYREFGFDGLPIELGDRCPYVFTSEGGERQGHIIAELANKSDTVVCGTDPDREGQGIFSRFFDYYKIERPKMLRLWSPSLTDKDLDKAWAKMRPLSEYKNLAAACDVRTRSDWLIGMNLSRAYACAFGSRLSIGRVQTALLRMIVDRDHAVENYTESFYYMLRGKWGSGGISFLYHDNHNETKFDNKGVLAALVPVIEADKFRIIEFKEESKINNPLRPFNLSECQKAANRKFKMTAARTLEVVQELYLAKLVTYPRTDSQYLPTSDLAEYHNLVAGVATEAQKKFLIDVGSCPACVKDTDSAHTALIITGEEPKSLTKDQQNIYDLIKERFVCAFMKPNKFWQYSLVIGNEGDGMVTADIYKFKATVKVHEDRGFLDYSKDDKDEDAEKDDSVEMSERLDEGKLRSILEPMEKPLRIEDVKRSKPKYYTPATLLVAMQTCGRNISDPMFKKILSETRGIGTPATQAEFPERLIKHGLIVDKGGSYVSTTKGRALVANILSKLQSPEMTAEWEMKLKLIEDGDYEPQVYMRELMEFINEGIDDAKSKGGKVVLPTGTVVEGVKCPACGGDVYEYNSLFTCINATKHKDEDPTGKCPFKVFKTVGGKADAITFAAFKKLLDGKIIKLSGLKSKDGTKYKGEFHLDKDNGYVLVAVGKEKRWVDGVSCPACGGGVREFEKLYSCENSLSHGDDEEVPCKFKVWKKIGKTVVTHDVLKEIITTKRSGDITMSDTYEVSAPRVEYVVVGKCPLCGKDVMDYGNKAYSCSGFKDGCKFSIWKETSGVTISVDTARELLDRRETSQPVSMKLENGESHNVKLKLNNYNRIELSGDSVPSKYTCPCCGGKIMETFGAFRDYICNGCGFKVPFVHSRHRYTPEEINEIFTNGGTSNFIKDYYSSQKDKIFTAKPKVDKANKKITFEFPPFDNKASGGKSFTKGKKK